MLGRIPKQELFGAMLHSFCLNLQHLHPIFMTNSKGKMIL